MSHQRHSRLSLIFVIFLGTIAYCPCESKDVDEKFVTIPGIDPDLGLNTLEVTSGRIYYFAFATNMLSKRILLHNPTVKRIGPAALKNYRLGFSRIMNRWLGPIAEILPDSNSTVYGVLYTMDADNVEDLHRQETVPTVYAPMIAPVTILSNDCLNGSVVNALTYYLVIPPDLDPDYDHRPSKTLVKCLVKGAEENNLPADYIHFLKTIRHNGIVVPQTEKTLELDGVELIEDWTISSEEESHYRKVNEAFLAKDQVSQTGNI